MKKVMLGVVVVLFIGAQAWALGLPKVPSAPNIPTGNATTSTPSTTTAATGGGALDFKRKMDSFKETHHQKSDWNQIGNAFKNEFQTCYQQVKKQTDAGVSYTMYYVKCGRMFSDDGGTCVAQYIQCDTKKNVCRVDDPSYLSKKDDPCPPQPAETTRVKG